MMKKLLSVFFLLLLMSQLFSFLAASPVEATTWFHYDHNDGTSGNNLPHSTSGPYYWEYNPPGITGEGTAKYAEDTFLGKIAELTTEESQDDYFWQTWNSSGTFGTAFNEGNPITLSCNTTYYHGIKVRLQRIDGVDIFHDQDNGTDGPNSYTKLYEMYGSIRWLITAGWPNGHYRSNVTNLNHKFTFELYQSGIGCQTDLDCGNMIAEKVQNTSPYGVPNNPYLADYERWYSVLMTFKPSCSQTTNGLIELFINGTKVSSYSQKTQDEGLTPTTYRLQGLGTIAQPSYDGPSHKTQIKELIFTDELSVAQAQGFFDDPEQPSWCITEPDDTISRSYTTTSNTNASLVVFLPYYNHTGTTRASSVSWGGTSLTRIAGTSGDPASDYTTEIWVAPLGENHTGATNTLTVTFPSYVYGCAVVRQFNGINQTTPAHDGTAYDTEDDGTASLTVSNVIPTDTVIGAFIKADGAAAYTPGANQTALDEFRVPNLTTRRVLTTSKSGVNGGTVSATFGSTYHAGATVALRPASPIIPVGTTDTDGCVVDDTTITRSYTSTSGTNSALVVFLPYYNSSGTRKVSSVSWGATTLTRISGTSGTNPGDHAAEIWIAPLGSSHTSATNTLSITYTGSVIGCAIISQFNHVDQSTPAHDGIATNDTQESGTASLTVSNVASTDLLISVFIKHDGSAAYTLGGDQYTITEFQVPNLTTRRALTVYKSTTNGGTVSATFGSTYHGGAAAALKKAP